MHTLHGSAVSGTILASLLLALIGAAPAGAAGPVVGLEVSAYEYLDLPDMDFAVEGTNLGPSFSSHRDETHDGLVDGARFDFFVGGLGLGPIRVRAEGFYSYLPADDSRNTCQTQGGGAVGATFCTTIPIEFDPTAFAGAAVFALPTTFSQTVVYDTERHVDHWGAGLEIESRDPFVLGSLSVWPKAGFHFRRLDQDIDLRATGLGGAMGIAGGYVSYDEDLDTDYVGGYLGVRIEQTIGSSFVLGLDLEGGGYQANVDYQGIYDDRTSQFPTFGVGLVETSESQDEPAAIGSAKLSLGWRFGLVELAAFARGEYVSYAPQMDYSDRDSIFAPDNPETEVEADDYFSLSAGASVTLHF